MKCDLVNVPNKGICILISDINPKDFIMGMVKDGKNILNFGGGMFSDLYTIAKYIKEKKKISAIKEVRAQTGWGLRESKLYIEKYIPLDFIDFVSYSNCAEKFINDHAPKEDFIKNVDFEL